MTLNDRTKLIALAHLKNSESPTEVAKRPELDISYSQALKLSKQLVEAEKRNTVLELFNMEEAALETLLNTVSQELVLTGEILGVESSANTAANGLAKQLNGLDLLESEFQSAAIEIARNLKLQALASSEINTLLTAAEALSKLQTAFFAKGTNVQVNNINADGFEKYLQD